MTEEKPKDGNADGADLIPVVVDDVDEQKKAVTNKKSGTATYSPNNFWKYKKIPKGPKPMAVKLEKPHIQDPHQPLKFNDPAFRDQESAGNTSVKIKLGEGNDITPNLEKLLQLGEEILVLEAKMKSRGGSSGERKEKMRLSSKICRMKQTASHEANKVKFAGLEQEREQLCRIIKTMRNREAAVELYNIRAAGCLDDYVNNLLETLRMKPSVQSYSDTSR